MKSLKLKQQEAEPTSTPRTPHIAQKNILFYPSSKISSPHDLQLAHKRDIHFKRTRLTENFNSNAYKRLIKRNLKYIRHSELCTFGSRPSLYLLQKLNQQELNQQIFPMIAGKPQGNFGLGMFDNNHVCFIEKRDTVRFFRFLCRNNIAIQSLKSFYHFVNDQLYQRKYMKYLTRIASLKVVYNSDLEWRKNTPTAQIFGAPKYPDVDLDQIYHRGLASFGKLEKISLDFRNAYTENAHTQSFFFEIIKMLTQISSLKAIEITIAVHEVEKKVQKLKTFTEKLTQLKSLKLNFAFHTKLTDTGKIFTAVLPLPTLKHLSINLLSLTMRSINCSDLADFIGSMKNLESFEFTVPRLLFDEYVKVFEAISKLKSLTKLTVIQTGRFHNSFAFGILFKTLNALKKLTSIKIDLGSLFDNNELNAYPQHLLKHPTLKRAKIALQVSPEFCQTTDEFFANIHRLRDKLHKLQLTLVCFPIEAQKKIKRIINRNKVDSKHFSCKTAELTGYPRLVNFGGVHNDNDDGYE